MSGSIHDLIDEALAHAQAVWESVVPADLSNLHDLGGKVAHSLDDLFEKITNNGTLPVPNPRDWLPEQLQPAAAAAAPAPVPLAPAPLGASAWLHRIVQHTARHPYAYATAAIGLSGGASYYWAPHATLRVLEPVTSWVPVALLPDPANRPLRLTPAHHGVAGEVRKEAVVVLGADSPHGRELALDLERKGFVVVATVADPANVDTLERSSRGWLKVLVLDPHESSSVSPFLRSLSTALSLRYPLHSSGDPFSRPAHALALTGVVNCLSLASTAAGSDAPYPLEATENDAVRRHVGERVATVIGVLKGLLPILRNAASRPGAPTGVLISLVPSASSNLSLPFASLASAADAAIASVLNSLRRELAASTSTDVRLTTLEVGFFQTTPVPTTMAAHRSSTDGVAPLPIRLESVYAPALARRSPLETANENEATTTAAAAGKSARKGTEMRKLCKRVWQILVRPAHAGAVARVGSGSWTYLFVSYLPHAVVDFCLGVQDRLYGIYFNHVRELVSSRRGRAIDSSGPSTARGPLPTPPTSANAGGPFRPGPAQVPLADPFMPTPSPAPSSSRGGGGYSSCDEASSQSSTEDFGPLGGSGYASGSASMGGSFVSVRKDEAE